MSSSSSPQNNAPSTSHVPNDDSEQELRHSTLSKESQEEPIASGENNNMDNNSTDNGPAVATFAAPNSSSEESPQPSTTELLPLDWTHMGGAGTPTNEAVSEPVIRYPTDVAPALEVSEDGELVMVGTAGQKITRMGPDLSKLLLQACLANNTQLRKLVFRSHLIQEMQGLEGLTDLELLELYDNQVQELTLTPNLVTLTILDMSYNSIRDMTPVQVCSNLRELYLANNKLRDISGLKGLVHLKKLDLGANRIRAMPPDELSGLHSIEELWLGKNKIEKIQGLSTLTHLRRLDIQSNRLRELDGPQFATIASTLEELYLAHNGLTSESLRQDGGGWLEEGRVFQQLTVLDFSRNQFASANELGNPQTFPVLEELWISGNQISEWSAVEQLVKISTLETLYLEYNPIQTNDPLYRKSLAQMIPQLKQIDATFITAPSFLGPSGLVRGGAPLPFGESQQDRIRQYQEMVFQRAQNEDQQHQQNQQQQEQPPQEQQQEQQQEQTPQEQQQEQQQGQPPQEQEGQ